jgi:hypothetical protein
MTDHETELRLMAVDDELSIPRRDAAAWAVGEIDRLRAQRDTLRAEALDWRGQVGELSDQLKALRAQLEAARGEAVREVVKNHILCDHMVRSIADIRAAILSLSAADILARVKGGDDEPPGALDAI